MYVAMLVSGSSLFIYLFIYFELLDRPLLLYFQSHLSEKRDAEKQPSKKQKQNQPKKKNSFHVDAPASASDEFLPSFYLYTYFYCNSE